ncbi:DHBP synthase RibB-like alpha/beta domain-containing protein [Collybia nuda]|uniref:Threonylcarbamoyl-AMP synthase n=1 Tax=Collybia nuda TaxID=64659 RepID=A0A9P5Y5G2_9AGAR|nr:DHBP synthase RibB-like alpha/beta domain-containing protein [Collybia nuda]
MFILTTFFRTLRQKYSHLMAPYSTRVLNCDSSAITFHSTSDHPDITCQETLNALKTASHHLVDHLECVAFPTETVYGLGAVASSNAAAAHIFSTKGRPPDNPLIIHISSFTMLNSILPENYTWPRAYEILVKHFWPGALTLLFPRNPEVIPAIITADQPTVAIRMPSHPVARALIAIANVPLAAPSANTSGKPSPTRAEHVVRDLDGKINVILDGGACGVGLESTVVDGLHEDGNIRVLRPGGVTVEDMEKILQEEMADFDHIPRVLVHRRDYLDELVEQTPTTPGMKYRHYSPSVPVTLLLTKTSPPADNLAISATSFFASLINAKTLKIGVLAPADSLLWGFMPLVDGLEWCRYQLGPSTQPSAAAHRLFDGLLTLEARGVDLMLIEEVGEEREGLAVMNRVRKAAGDIRWISFE